MAPMVCRIKRKVNFTQNNNKIIDIIVILLLIVYMEIIEESRIMMNLINKVLEENEFPPDVLGLIFSNFETDAQKQQKPHLENLFSILSLSFEIQAKNQLRKNILNEEQNNILESLRLNRDADKITMFLCENCGYVSTENIPKDCPHCVSNKIRIIKD